MRTKAERAVLHTTEKQSLRRGKLSNRPFFKKDLVKLDDKTYSVKRIGGQDFYTEIKTRTQAKKTT